MKFNKRNFCEEIRYFGTKREREKQNKLMNLKRNYQSFMVAVQYFIEITSPFFSFLYVFHEILNPNK